MVNSSRNIFFEIKKLITHHDYNKIDEGIELLVKSNNVLFFEKILRNCSIRDGILFVSESLTVAAPRQPKIDYALWNIIGKCPINAKIDKSLLKKNIKNVKLRRYESYLLHYHYVERFPIGITEFKNLKTLDFSDAIVTYLPKEISKLNKLSILNLTSNKIEQFQDEICNIISLKELILSDNSIKILPEQLGNLINLEILDLDNNELKFIPDSISCLTKLKSITLDSNKIKTLTKSIGKIQNIKELNLGDNRLSTLPKSINNLNNLISLSLSNNLFFQFPKIELENLKELNLSANNLTIIPNEIRKLKNLEKLYLSGNRALGVFESGISFLDKLNTIQLGTTGKLKPKPKVLYLNNRNDVEDFFMSIKLLYKLVQRKKADKTIKGEKFKPELVIQNIENKIKVYDANDDIIANLSNYINSNDIDKIDIGLDLIINLNNQEVYNRIFKKWEINSGRLNYIYYNDGFAFDTWYKDYCIFKLLTSAESDIVFPNNIDFLNLKVLDYKFTEDRYPDFLIKFFNLEDITLNCRGQILKDDFHSLKKLKSIELRDLNNLDEIKFTAFEDLNRLELIYCKNSSVLNLSNQINLTSLKIEGCDFKNIQIENNPILESIDFCNVDCAKLIIKNCPKLKNIKFYRSDLTPEFEFSKLNELKKIELYDSTFNNFNDFISMNNHLEILSIKYYESFEIPKIFSQLKNLKELIIKGCNLKILPDLIGDLENLEILKLSDNELKSIPESLANLTKLRIIDFGSQSGTTKDYNSLKDLPLNIFKNENLTDVKINWSSLKMRKFESKLAAANLLERSGIISN
jgi:Leucine-rich repeat (LRR) protein